MTRGVAFWNDDLIALVRDHFIAASVPTWVCRAEGSEGEFLRLAGIDKQWVTSSGYMTCVSASGRNLGRRPSQKVLEAFAALPEAERQAGAVKVPQERPDDAVIPDPPDGGLVLRVHARFLHRGEDGQLRRARTTDFPLMRENPKALESWKLFLQPNTEFMWLTRDELGGLVPADPAIGRRLEVDPAIVERMARFHLTPQRATTSEAGIKRQRDIREARLAVVVEDVSQEKIVMKIEGRVAWGSEFEEGKATSPNGPLDQGFETVIQGRLAYDRRGEKFTRFDLVAPGEVWGRWGDANRKSMYVERPGRAPFGFAFELGDMASSPTDRIPPGGNGRYVETRGYFAEEKR